MDYMDPEVRHPPKKPFNLITHSLTQNAPAVELNARGELFKWPRYLSYTLITVQYFLTT